MGLIRITPENWSRYKDDVYSLESEACYPLGSDFFRLDHGSNYFAFFERLGEVYYYGWTEGGKVVAVAAGILRRLPDSAGTRSWYLCDLKVLKNFRGQHIPLRMLARALPFNYLRCRRSYAIAMNTKGSDSNPTVHLLERFRWLRFGASSQLLIWSLNFHETLEVLPVLEKDRGLVSFSSLLGIKDLILQSTGQPMPLLHAQYGDLGGPKGHPPTEGAIHMFCVPEADPLASKIQTQLKLKPSASATIVSHGLERMDWRWVLTSEI